MKRDNLAIGECYHIFNRGVEKRTVFNDESDMRRFLKNMVEFNREEPIGSLYENYFYEKKFGNRVSKRLVDVVCYCLNPNHYHLILRQISESGISKFLHKCILGYTKYYNQKNRRVGPLFQGPYKSIHVASNEYLLHLSVYVNLNFRVHGVKKYFYKSSWEEYINLNWRNNFCQKGIVLKQFENPVEYKAFAESSLESIRDSKKMQKIEYE